MKTSCVIFANVIKIISLNNAVVKVITYPMFDLESV